MKELQEEVKKLIEFIGFREFSVSCDAEGNRIALFVADKEIREQNMPTMVAHFDHLIKLMAKKRGIAGVVFVDVNNYRREREKLLLELARGAARKVVATNQEIALPPMNAYERRLIHSELASRPDVKTESIGEGRNRYVVVKPIE